MDDPMNPALTLVGSGESVPEDVDVITTWPELMMLPVASAIVDATGEEWYRKFGTVWCPVLPHSRFKCRAPQLPARVRYRPYDSRRAIAAGPVLEEVARA